MNEPFIDITRDKAEELILDYWNSPYVQGDFRHYELIVDDIIDDGMEPGLWNQTRMENVVDKYINRRREGGV